MSQLGYPTTDLSEKKGEDLTSSCFDSKSFKLLQVRGATARESHLRKKEERRQQTVPDKIAPKAVPFAHYSD